MTVIPAPEPGAKRKAGRQPRLATLDAERSSWQRYPLGEFTAAPPRDASPAAGQGKVQLEGAPRRLRDLDELPPAVTQRTRMLIVQGDDPDDQLRYSSRSEVTFAVCCEMVRAKCTDEQIAAVLTDPDFGISRHTLAQKSGSLKYAARQIERARAEVEEPMLAQLNADHAVIELYGGKTKVVSWEPSEVVYGFCDPGGPFLGFAQQHRKSLAVHDVGLKIAVLQLPPNRRSGKPGRTECRRAGDERLEVIDEVARARGNRPARVVNALTEVRPHALDNASLPFVAQVIRAIYYQSPAVRFPTAPSYPPACN